MVEDYNPEWGARPMARVIEDTVELYLAEKILAKELETRRHRTLRYGSLYYKLKPGLK
jgi:ATP-dependent Clp protease ATP-binding subunit ClpA